jgi:hypothetical protein
MKRINITVTEEEYQILSNSAKSEGRPVSTLVKMRALFWSWDNNKSSQEEEKRPPTKVNPYIGWVIMPNPDGNTKPFYSEYHGFTMLEISNPKPPFQKVVLKEGSEWYDYFNKQ